MIDFATQARKKRQLDPIELDPFKMVSSILSNPLSETGSALPDAARRIISSNPVGSVALAFAIGGLIGWLTSKR